MRSRNGIKPPYILGWRCSACGAITLSFRGRRQSYCMECDGREFKPTHVYKPTAAESEDDHKRAMSEYAE